MKRIVVSVRDRASETYGSPFMVVARGQAIRGFTDEVNRQHAENALYQHPEDFDLYQLGFYEDTTGMYETGVPELLVRGLDVVDREDGPKLRAVQ